MVIVLHVSPVMVSVSSTLHDHVFVHEQNLSWLCSCSKSQVYKRHIGVIRVMEAPVELIAFNMLDALILEENIDGCICKSTC